MAKQTFTTGQVLTAAQMTDLQATAMGGGAASTKTASYVLVAADAGTTVAMNAAGATTITVNTGLFAAGDTVFIQNIGAGVCTITAGTATVNTAGALALPQYDAGILYFTSASAAIFYDYIQVGAASPLTTKGDLYTFSTSDTRLGVGANNTVLTADSAQATGLKWVAPSSGALTLITSGSLSGTSISLDNVFSATYDSYLLCWIVTTTDGEQRIRFRASGTDNTSANYRYANAALDVGATPNFATLSGSGGTDFTLGLPAGVGSNRYGYCLNILSPFDSSVTTKYNGTFYRGANGGGFAYGAINSNSSFDGITVYNTGSTWSGTYQVYGYAK